jgi:hypothetical protein
LKKDAHEFAHLIKAFKGAAEYMWESFDHVFLSAVYQECVSIDDEIQKDINAKQNKLEIGDPGKGASFSNLEDSPITPEQQKMFDELLRKAQAKTKQSKAS